jgi:aminoglycoside 2'-N-acetyltransferase I
MVEGLCIEVVPGKWLSQADAGEILSMCNRAYEEDLAALFDTFSEPIHVLAYFEDRLVGHAMWVTRWLQPGKHKPLRSAYVEMVATEPEFQRRGIATKVMERVAEAMVGYELGGLCPAEPGVYSRLGWEFWRGPLFIRTENGYSPTPDERVMVLRLPESPPFDLDDSLSAEWRPGEVW